MAQLAEDGETPRNRSLDMGTLHKVGICTDDSFPTAGAERPEYGNAGVTVDTLPHEGPAARYQQEDLQM